MEKKEKDKEKWEKTKKYPKPWDQKTHDRFVKESGMTEEDHEKWHRKQEKSE